MHKPPELMPHNIDPFESPRIPHWLQNLLCILVLVVFYALAAWADDVGEPPAQMAAAESKHK
ncbi:hypothetical protein [Chitinimonas sp.]|uniref:hypothetical protein n=1 Tax=Chitinimonas sp. TaxID=1934313 RepID=UPI0035AF6296